MANKTSDIKNNILKLLWEADGQTVSGVTISHRLEVSRVAVWKHIDALKKAGINIVSNPKGYCLKDREDLLMPFCFDPVFQDRIFHFSELESTMDKARYLAKNNAPHLSAVIAENQSAGRGRLNRKWFSSKGGLWFTLILKPDTPPVTAYIYNFAASLSLAVSLRDLFNIEVFVKWPNDLLLNNKKLCGLLSEMETRGDMVEFVNIGIGLNVNNHPEKDEPTAISLSQVLNRTLSRKQILEAFLHNFKNRINDIDCNTVIKDWKQVTSTIGTKVKIQTLKETFEGYARDVDESGALIIEDDSGGLQKIIYGDCFHT